MTCVAEPGFGDLVVGWTRVEDYIAMPLATRWSIIYLELCNCGRDGCFAEDGLQRYSSAQPTTCFMIFPRPADELLTVCVTREDRRFGVQSGG